jgi:hypothetical protein
MGEFRGENYENLTGINQDISPVQESPEHTQELSPEIIQKINVKGHGSSY